MNKKITAKLLKAIYKILIQKANQIFFIIFSIYKNIKINIIRDTKKVSEKNHVKDMEIFLKKKKTKSINMLVSDIEIFRKKKKKRSMITIFLKKKKEIILYQLNTKEII